MNFVDRSGAQNKATLPQTMIQKAYLDARTISKRHLHTRPRDGAQTERSEESALQGEMKRGNCLFEAARSCNQLTEITRYHNPVKSDGL